MRKKLLIASALALLLIAGIGAANWQNKDAYAKKEITAGNAKQMMSKYSPPNKKAAGKPVRVSRLKEMNIVGEAATVLNVLPITIIDEMKKGKTVAQIAQEKGLTEQAFTKKLTDLETKTVNAAVQSGTITKQQGDAITQGRSDRLKKAMKEKAMKVTDRQPMDMGN